MRQKKVLFLYLGTESLAIEALSAYLKSKGHAVEFLMDPALFSGWVLYNNKLLEKLFDSRGERKLKNSIAKSNPDLIGFSVFTGNYIWALKWAKICKELFPRVPVIFGGIHPTSVPEEVIRQEVVDIVVVGEGEGPVEEMLRMIDGNSIPLNIMNTVVKDNGKIISNPIRPYVRNLDAYPFFDKQLFYDKIPGLEECYLTMTGRGCHFSCTYCGNSIVHKVYNFEKNHVRMRSVDNVLEELKIVKKRGKTKQIFFCNDVFIFSKKWLEEFTPKYKKEIGIPFWCTVHPAFVDKDIVKLLKEAGCWLVTMGVQSGSPRIRRNIFRRLETNESIMRASELIRKSGIKLGLDNIFGAPTEKEEDLMEALNLYQATKPERIHTFWLTYFPKTDILEKAVQEGNITAGEISNLEQGHISQFDFGGAVKFNVKMYLKYEFLYHFLSLFGYNDRIKRICLKMKYFIPANHVVNKALIILNAVKNRDTKFFYLVKTLFLRRNVP